MKKNITILRPAKAGQLPCGSSRETFTGEIVPKVLAASAAGVICQIKR